MKMILHEKLKPNLIYEKNSLWNFSFCFFKIIS